MRPRLGFRPTSPQQAAGIRIEPPPSLPWATGQQTGRDRRGGPAGGAPGRPFQVPGVAGGPEDVGLADGQDPVLGQRGGADDHEPGAASAGW